MTNRIHTLASIASGNKVKKRAVQSWLKKAVAEHGEVGALEDGTRKFNDAERETIVSYAGAKPSTKKTAAKAVTPEPVKAIEVVDAEPEQAAAAIVPSTVNVAAITGKPMATVDLSSPQAMIQSMGQIRAALHSRVTQSWEQYQQTAQTAAAFDNELQQLQQAAQTAQIQTTVAAQMQTTEAAKLEASMGKFAALTTGGNPE